MSGFCMAQRWALGPPCAAPGPVLILARPCTTPGGEKRHDVRHPRVQAGPPAGRGAPRVGSTASAFRPLWGQGVTTAAMSGVVAAKDGTPLADATIVAVHVPSGTQYRAVTRAGGADNVQIGRAAWRGRVEISVVAGSLKKKKKDD